MKEHDSDDEEEMNTYKVILVGESDVGKTCIMYRFTKDVFKENSSPSLTASYAEKIIKLKKYGEKEIQFGIWDTVGQEKFRSISNNFFLNANAAILVYDITKKSSFEEIKKFWYNHVIENCPRELNKSLFINLLLL